MPVGMTAFPCDDLVSTMPCDVGQWHVAPLADCGASTNATRVAVLGGYGSHDGGCSQRVAALLRQVERQFGPMHAVLTTGGNNFPHGDAKTFEPNVATPYGRFFEAGERPSFFPTIGASDFERPFAAGGTVPYMRFFRYLANFPGPDAVFLRGQAYRATLAGGALDVFTINSNLGNPDAPFADITQVRLSCLFLPPPPRFGRTSSQPLAHTQGGLFTRHAAHAHTGCTRPAVSVAARCTVQLDRSMEDRLLPSLALFLVPPCGRGCVSPSCIRVCVYEFWCACICGGEREREIV